MLKRCLWLLLSQEAFLKLLCENVLWNKEENSKKKIKIFIFIWRFWSGCERIRWTLFPFFTKSPKVLKLLHIKIFIRCQNSFSFYENTTCDDENCSVWSNLFSVAQKLFKPQFVLFVLEKNKFFKNFYSPLITIFFSIPIF